LLDDLLSVESGLIRKSMGCSALNRLLRRPRVPPPARPPEQAAFGRSIQAFKACKPGFQHM
jgi:hypothetical protein